MLDGFQGRTVEVKRAIFEGTDSYGNPQRTYADPEPVSDVLIAPGDATDRIEDGHPYGVEVTYTLYIPKSEPMDLRDALVTIDGEDYRVVGDPKPYPAELTPGGRNLVVKVARNDG